MITNSSTIPFCVFVFLTLLFLVSLSTLILAILNMLSSDKTKNWVIGTFGIIYTLAYFCVLCYYSIKFCTQAKRKVVRVVIQQQIGDDNQQQIIQVEGQQQIGDDNQQQIIQVEGN